jgi:uracil-DNA glycosylase
VTRVRSLASAALGRMEEPAPDCPLCPRLAAYRADTAKKQPSWFNAPVPSFGPREARVLIVGLAPGVSGANRTGRPFTGDYAGDLLYATLFKFGFAKGKYEARPDDGLTLVDCRITNAVRCVPPENKPTPEEATTCRVFLNATLEGMTNLTTIVALGRIAHDATLRAFDRKLSAHPFAHGVKHDLGRVTLIDSFHCSRYNTNTRKLTPAMFEAVFGEVKRTL